MCSNFESIHPKHANWVKQHFACDLPNSPWCEEIYPTYPAPFIYLENGQPKCELAQFGLRTYNARTETLQKNLVIAVHGKSAALALPL